MLTRIKNFFCRHDWELKQLNIGSVDLIPFTWISTHYHHCKKCNKWDMSKRYESYSDKPIIHQIPNKFNQPTESQNEETVKDVPLMFSDNINKQLLSVPNRKYKRKSIKKSKNDTE